MPSSSRYARKTSHKTNGDVPPANFDDVSRNASLVVYYACAEFLLYAVEQTDSEPGLSLRFEQIRRNRVGAGFHARPRFFTAGASPRPTLQFPCGMCKGDSRIARMHFALYRSRTCCICTVFAYGYRVLRQTALHIITAITATGDFVSVFIYMFSVS